MNEVYRNNVRGKIYRLLYNMNKDTRIQVQTPVGLTRESVTGETVGQGTVEGAVISAVNLDNGVAEQFDDDDEITYGDVQLGPMLFQDDVARLSLTVTSAQSANLKMEEVAERKLLDFNLSKSCYVVIGSKQRRLQMMKQLEDTPLTLCNSEMVSSDTIKYLGDLLSCNGLKDSVKITVAKRRQVVSRACYEIRHIVDDFRSQTVGGLAAGLQLWEMCVIPMLLYNSETWLEIGNDVVVELEKMQYSFLRYLFAIGNGCPLPLLLSETGTILIELRILKRKVLFLHHLENLPEESLAKQVYNAQTRMCLPGIIHECSEFLAKFGLSDLKQFSKSQFKKVVTEKIKFLNKEKLIQLIRDKRYKKINIGKIELDNFEQKPYLNNLTLYDARLRFRIESQMVESVKMNFQSDRAFKAELWKCTACGKSDSQQHLLYCEGYKVYRKDRDLSQDKDLVAYFRNIIQDRLDNM